MSGRVINPYSQFLGDDGIPVESGTVTFYINQTTVLAVIYSDLGQSTIQTNPYTLDANGRIKGDVYFTDLMTMELRDVNGALIRTDDNVTSTGGAGGSTAIFPTSLQLKAASVAAGNNVKTNGLNLLLDGGNAEYYILTLDEYGGVPPDESTSPDISIANTNVAVKLADSVLPRLGVIQYHGSITDIPAGWSLCDGSNGTPNLSGAFVLATSIPSEQDETGGTADISYSTGTAGHVLTSAQVPNFPGISIAVAPNTQSDSHTIDATVAKGSDAGQEINPTPIQTPDYGDDQPHSHNITAPDGTNANLPPFYKMAFIMRTGEIKQVVQAAPPEQVGSYINVSGAVELDAEFGAITVFIVQPSGTITDLSIINAPTEIDSAYAATIKIISDGSSTVAWNPMFKWELSTPPGLTLITGNYDAITAFTTDLGVTYGSILSLGDIVNVL